MRILFVVLCLSLSGCASTPRWWEYPGIGLGGATYGAVIGPENVSIREAHRRWNKSHPNAPADEFVPSYAVGTAMHYGTLIPLLVYVTPWGLGYLSLSSIVGAAQFIDRNAWEEEYGP